MLACPRRACLRDHAAWCCVRLLASGAKTAEDFYQLLGLQRGASAEEVKVAYRREALRWHPDRHISERRDAAQERFKLLSQAYQTLSSPEERRRYDERQSFGSAGGRAWEDAQRETSQGRAWQAQQNEARRPRAGDVRGGPGGFTNDDAERLFNDAFGGAAGLAEMLRRAQGRGGVGLDTLFEQLLRNAATTGRVEVHDEVFTRPGGQRVLRRTRTTVSRDGRTRVEVEELADESLKPQAAGGSLIDAARALVAPFAIAATSQAATFVARVLTGTVLAVVRAVVRRLFGGR